MVDRSGVTQVVLRDRFAGPHTVDMAIDKAWTAVSFRTPTGETREGNAARLGAERNSQSPARRRGGRRTADRGRAAHSWAASASPGAPGGDRDDVCAKAGIDSIRDSLEF